MEATEPREYCYQFKWNDKTKYLYNTNFVDAKKDFQETFGFYPTPDTVQMKRMEPGFSVKGDPFTKVD